MSAARIDGLRCAWCEGNPVVATEDDFAWLSRQGDAFGMGFQQRYDSRCWEHDVCEDCGGGGVIWFESETEPGCADQLDCGSCNGDGLLHGHCGRPAGLCDCDDEGPA